MSRPTPKATVKRRARNAQRVVFLDMDGVVARYDPDATAMERLLRPAVARLNAIIAATGAKVVISSTWRLDPATGLGYDARQLQAWLVACGFTGEVIDITPTFRGIDVRGLEILSWIHRQTRAPKTIAILDDCEPMGTLTPWLVQTTTEFLDEHVPLAIDLLLRGPAPPAAPKAPARQARGAVRRSAVDTHGTT